MKLLIPSVAFALMLLSSATTPVYQKETIKLVPVHEVVEQMPQFIGGQEAMNEWFRDNLFYPAQAFLNGIQGVVVVTFIVEKDGSLSSVQVVESVDPYLDAESIRAVRAMPRWQSGRHLGEVVRVRQALPITFVITIPTQ